MKIYNMGVLPQQEAPQLKNAIERELRKLKEVTGGIVESIPVLPDLTPYAKQEDVDKIVDAAKSATDFAAFKAAIIAAFP